MSDYESVNVIKIYPASEGWMIQTSNDITGNILERYNITGFALVEINDAHGSRISKKRVPCINLNGEQTPFLKKCSVIYIPSIYGGGF